jgi:hypothetical protein
MIGTLLFLAAVSVVAKRYGIDVWQACSCSAEGRGNPVDVDDKEKTS